MRSSQELKEGRSDHLDGLNKVVFIQCVGSRSERDGAPYCSSICCTTAIRQAIALKELLPRAEVYVLYIDRHQDERKRPGGPVQGRARRARGQVRSGSAVHGPALTGWGTEGVRGERPRSRELYELRADLVVLCTGLGPGRATRDLLKGPAGTRQDISGYPYDTHPVVLHRPGRIVPGRVGNRPETCRGHAGPCGCLRVAGERQHPGFGKRDARPMSAGLTKGLRPRP